MTLTHQALRTLVWLGLNPETSSGIPEDVCPSGEVGDVANQLKQNGWGAVVEPSLAGPNISLLDGKDRAALRLKRKYRFDAAQVRMLQWVADHDDTGNSVDVAQTEGAEDFTGRLEESLFERADSALKNEYGLIEGIGVNAPGTIRPKLTSRGEQVLASGFAPADYFEAKFGGSVNNYSNTVNGSVGAIQQGSHNMMTVTQNNNPELADALGYVEQIRRFIDDAGLASDDAESAQMQVDLVESAVKANKTPGVIKKLIDQIAQSLGSGIGRDIHDLGSQVIDALPS